LVLNLAWIMRPTWFGFDDADVAARASFVSVALWWTVFSIPLYRRVSEPVPSRMPVGPGGAAVWQAAFGRLGETFRELRRFRAAFLMLLAFFFYNDGINTIIRMASLYGTQIGIAQAHLMGALVLVQFVGIPFSFLFGSLAGRVGTKRAIFFSLVVYVIVAFVGFRMTTAAEFYLLAVLVATVLGGSQALSRSLFASLIPRRKAAEFFGFFAVSEKFAGVLGPLVFAQSVQATGSGRLAILGVAGFFVIGGALLSCVDVAGGRAAARQAETQAG
jgi:UMF1 family MFS transporter